MYHLQRLDGIFFLKELLGLRLEPGRLLEMPQL